MITVELTPDEFLLIQITVRQAEMIGEEKTEIKTNLLYKLELLESLEKDNLPPRW